MKIRNDLILEDTTLRDGEQAPGISFDRTTKLQILDALIDTGVKWIEGGINSMGEVRAVHCRKCWSALRVQMSSWWVGIGE